MTSSNPSLVKMGCFDPELMPALLHKISSGLPVSSQRLPRACTLAILAISTSHHSNSALSFPEIFAIALHSSTTEAGTVRGVEDWADILG